MRYQTLEVRDLGQVGKGCGWPNKNCWLGAHFQSGFAFIPCPHFVGSFLGLFIEISENTVGGFFSLKEVVVGSFF